MLAVPPEKTMGAIIFMLKNYNLAGG